jgi:hypothetical protein
VIISNMSDASKTAKKCVKELKLAVLMRAFRLYDLDIKDEGYLSTEAECFSIDEAIYIAYWEKRFQEKYYQISPLFRNARMRALSSRLIYLGKFNKTISANYVLAKREYITALALHRAMMSTKSIAKDYKRLAVLYIHREDMDREKRLRKAVLYKRQIDKVLAKR